MASSPALRQGLELEMLMVRVEPPLFVNGPSSGSMGEAIVPQMSPFQPLVNPKAPSAFSIRLCPSEENEPNKLVV